MPDEPVLNRGVGRIVETAKPGEAGNIAIAGHRDGFFRCLKDIQIGDRIELATPKERFTYTVEAIRVVNPEEVGVLLPRKPPGAHPGHVLSVLLHRERSTALCSSDVFSTVTLFNGCMGRQSAVERSR